MTKRPHVSRWSHVKRRKKLARQVREENAAKCKPGRVIYSRDAQT